MLQEILPQSKVAAVAAGSKFFFTGKPCKRGHLSARNTKGGTCRECCKENLAAWNLRNPGATDARLAAFLAANPGYGTKNSARWRAANPDRDAALNRATYERNKDKTKARAKVWKKQNPEWFTLNNRARRAKKAGSNGYHTQAQIDAMLEDQHGECNVCRVDIRGGYEADHIMPISRGGSNLIENIQLLCMPCNRRKSAKHPAEFAKMIPQILASRPAA